MHLVCTLLITVGTKMIADLEKCFQELISEKLLILLREMPCLELIIVSSNFQALLFLQDRLLESVWKLVIPVKILKIAGPALSRINSVIFSARTAISVLITHTPTLTLLIVFGIDFKSVVGNGFWDQSPGCKGICISPPLLLDVFPLRITLFELISKRLHSHLHFLLFSNYECNRCAPKGLVSDPPPPPKGPFRTKNAIAMEILV